MSLPRPQSDYDTMLCDRLDRGEDLADALRAMHKDDDVGMMFLWRAVQAVRQIPRRDAMRTTVRAINVLYPDRF